VKPVSFSFVLHLHQPVGNFDHVIREHATQVYRPLFDRLVSGGILPLGLHVSGPLLAWLDREDPAFLDAIGEQVEAGTVELLTSGRYEPILAALGPTDRAAQLRWMAELIRARFGVETPTLWLTERVWEDTIVPELAAAGVHNVLVDDWHFRVSGFTADQLVRPFRTEVGGSGLNLLPISEPLRYLIPFSSADRIVEHLRVLSEREVPFVAFGDDGEKFGGWPGTRKWVWESGWIDQFIHGLRGAAESGWIEFVTPSQAVERVSSAGSAYLGSASYREMEEWTLPPRLIGGYQRMLSHAGHEDPSVDALARVRGSHWRNFLIRYPAANRLHKKALALSGLARESAAPDEVLHAIGRAQSNDPLWHGVFGGVYMKHLRDSAWRCLAEAESALRVGQELSYDIVDLDFDGHDEVWVHSEVFSAVVSPSQGGAIVELTVFAEGVNEADVLTRHREAYHAPAVEKWKEREASQVVESGADAEEFEGEAASIHDLEAAYVLESLPPTDARSRSLVVELVLPAGQGALELEAGSAKPQWSATADAAEGPDDWRVLEGGSPSDPTITLEFDFAHHTKRVVFDEAGLRRVEYRWAVDAFDVGTVADGATWTVEVSCQSAIPPVVESEVAPSPAGEYAARSYSVVTVPRSERGFERIKQGTAYVFQWPVTAGHAALIWPRT
jgi:hypothetical protein